MVNLDRQRQAKIKTFLPDNDNAGPPKRAH